MFVANMFAKCTTYNCEQVQMYLIMCNNKNSYMQISLHNKRHFVFFFFYLGGQGLLYLALIILGSAIVTAVSSIAQS